MTGKPATPTNRPYADISPAAATAALPKLNRRLDEVTHWPDPVSGDEAYMAATSLATKVNTTLREVFGPETFESHEYRVSSSQLTVNYMSVNGPHPLAKFVEAFRRGKKGVAARLQTIIELLAEKAASEDGDPQTRILSAYKALDLHPTIAEAASDLYGDGHYASAILDAVIALNNLVRTKSGRELDGDKLMTTAFSPDNPLVRFNELQDQSDKDEQRGFMMMFAGAVSGLRNPRAHKLIKDDPERALEFIAFVSLLAKLLESAKKVRPPA